MSTSFDVASTVWALVWGVVSLVGLTALFRECARSLVRHDARLTELERQQAIRELDVERLEHQIKLVETTVDEANKRATRALNQLEG